jgi:HEAT repeat protein
MRSHKIYTLLFAVAFSSIGCCFAAAKDAPAPDKAALDNAITALKTFDTGADLKILKPIDDAVIALQANKTAFKDPVDAANALQANKAALMDLETKLAAVLPTGASRAAKDYVCRKLMLFGTAESVPALAALLADKDNSHMARYALERIPAPEAAKAMQEALPKLNGTLKIGVIGSLGARRDAASVPTLSALLGDEDKAIACAAACALGDIANADAAKALVEASKKSPEGVKAAIADASLACAERLLADGKKTEALKVYKAFTGEDQPKHVRMAATRGMLSVAEKKD